MRADRKQLVGLLPVDLDRWLPEGAQLVSPEHAAAQPPVPMLGHVTSSYRSPALGRTFALAMVAGGRDRIGGHVVAPTARRPDRGRGHRRRCSTTRRERAVTADDLARDPLAAHAGDLASMASRTGGRVRLEHEPFLAQVSLRLDASLAARAPDAAAARAEHRLGRRRSSRAVARPRRVAGARAAGHDRRPGRRSSTAALAGCTARSST